MKRQGIYGYRQLNYKVTAKIIDEFYEWCTQNYYTPTMHRLIKYVEKGFQDK